MTHETVLILDGALLLEHLLTVLLCTSFGTHPNSLG